MTISTVRTHRTILCRVSALALFAAGVVVPATASARQDTTAAVNLRGGLVIQPSQGVAYVMAVGGGIAAVDLATGAVRWTSRVGDRPLAVSGSVLVALAVPKGGGNVLELVGLDTREGATRTARNRMTLPSGVRVSVGETLHGTFLVDARPLDRDVLVDWRYMTHPLQGMAEVQDTLVGREFKSRAGPAVTRGALRMTVASGALRQIDTATVLPPRPPRWKLPERERFGAAGAAGAAGAGAAGTQYESVDARHVAVSERLDDDRVFAKYRWTVYERASGRQLGTFRTHLSFTPFVVRGSMLIYETTPYALGSEPEQPAKLRGINLATGKEAWSVAVQEIVYRGPFPP